MTFKIELLDNGRFKARVWHTGLTDFVGFGRTREAAMRDAVRDMPRVVGWGSRLGA
jgi:hypothetical protein